MKLSFFRLIYFILFTLSSQNTVAQEMLCQDGIDNDGDGLIDCSDGDCIGSSPCNVPVIDCTYNDENFTFTVAGSSVMGYTDEFLLTDLNGVIQDISITNSFNNVTPGDYQLFHLNYHNNSFIENNTINQNIGNITGDCFQVSGGFTIKVCPANTSCQVNVGLWLEGAFDESSNNMRTTLNDHQLLPGQKPIFFLGQETPAGQPFQNAPWNYTGIEGDNFDYQNVGDNKAGYPNDVVDWVLISFRNTALPESAFCTKAVWLHEDGSISFPLPCDCSLTIGQNVFVVIEHRNHLPIMTPTAIPVQNDGLSYDFRTNQSYITFFGDGQKLLSNGQYAMFSANGEQSNTLQDRLDINALDNAVWSLFNSIGDTYLNADFNMDGDTNSNDEVQWSDNTGKSSDTSFN